MAWLWRKPPAAAPIGPLAWELSHALGTALKAGKKKKKGTKYKGTLLTRNPDVPIILGLIFRPKEGTSSCTFNRSSFSFNYLHCILFGLFIALQSTCILYLK